MKDYENQLNAFRFTNQDTDSSIYFEKYWLSSSEIQDKWIKIMKSIFDTNFYLFPQNPFLNEYKLLVKSSGILFIESELNELQKCLQETGDSHIIIIEDYDESNPPHLSGPPLRFKYPSTIKWHEMYNSCGICYQLFGRPVRNYFVFGDTGTWGKYVGSDYEYPIDLWGIKDSYFDFFYTHFKNRNDEIAQLKENLTDSLATFLPFT